MILNYQQKLTRLPLLSESAIALSKYRDEQGDNGSVFRHIEGSEKAIVHAQNSNLMTEMKSTN